MRTTRPFFMHLNERKVCHQNSPKGQLKVEIKFYIAFYNPIFLHNRRDISLTDPSSPLRMRGSHSITPYFFPIFCLQVPKSKTYQDSSPKKVNISTGGKRKLYCEIVSFKSEIKSQIAMHKI